MPLPRFRTYCDGLCAEKDEFVDVGSQLRWQPLKGGVIHPGYRTDVS